MTTPTLSIPIPSPPMTTDPTPPPVRKGATRQGTAVNTRLRDEHLEAIDRIAPHLGLQRHGGAGPGGNAGSGLRAPAIRALLDLALTIHGHRAADLARMRGEDVADVVAALLDDYAKAATPAEKRAITRARKDTP